MSLADLIQVVFQDQQRRLSLNLVVVLFRELVKQVEYLHKRNYTHNNLSIHNIMLTFECYPIVASYEKVLSVK